MRGVLLALAVLNEAVGMIRVIVLTNVDASKHVGERYKANVNECSFIVHRKWCLLR